MTNKVGFEYRNKQGETVFETFLKYTDEKKNSSVVLGKILKRLLNRDGITFLDVGTGNGEYLALSLNQIENPLRIAKLILIEPSDSLVKRLRLALKNFPAGLATKVVRSTFEDFVPNGQFDIILMSHLPFPKDRLFIIFKKALKLLKRDGYLIIVLRKRDDVHKFRTKFKSQLAGKDLQSLTINDAVEVLNELAKIMPLNLSMFSSSARLRMPTKNNMRDVISIIEFLLNKRWKEFPDDVCKEVVNYIKRKRGILHQADGFALVQRK